MIALLLALGLSAPGAQAATLVVDSGGGEDYAAIQPAIDAAAAGDLVVVKPGTYYGPISFPGKPIRLVGESGDALTFIDGQGMDEVSVISLTGGEPDGTLIRGFTLTGGTGEEVGWSAGRSWTGGGLLVEDASVEVRACTFADNTAQRSGQSIGGGLGVIAGEVSVYDSVFEGNLGYYGGGGAAVSGGYLRIEDSLFVDNLGGRGGALLAADGAELDLAGNHYGSNQALWGGALYLQESVVTLSGDHFEDNRADRNAGAVLLRDTDLAAAELLMERSVASYDGGHFVVGPGATLDLSGSALIDGQASGGAGLYVWGPDAALTLEGVLLADSFASEAGGDLRVEEGVVLLSQITSLRASAVGEGSVLWAGQEAEVTGLNTAVVGSGGDSALYAEGSAVSWDYGLIYGVENAEVGGAMALDGEGLLSAEPMLTDPTASPPDVSPLEGSPLIDAGHPDLTDSDGSRADLGATGGTRPWTP